MLDKNYLGMGWGSGSDPVLDRKLCLDLAPGYQNFCVQILYLPGSHFHRL